MSIPVESENSLRTAEITLEDEYGMIDGIINNSCRGEELEKAQDEAHRTTPEKSPRSWVTYESEQKMAPKMVVLPGRERQAPV